MKPPAAVDTFEVMRGILRPLGLEAYAETFICFGYICLDDILSIHNDEIDLFGLQPLEKKRLTEFIEKSRKTSPQRKVSFLRMSHGLPSDSESSSESSGQQPFLTPRFP